MTSSLVTRVVREAVDIFLDNWHEPPGLGRKFASGESRDSCDCPEPMRSDLAHSLLGRRPPDMVVPACQRPDDGLRANGVGAVHEDHADSEGPPVERGFLHERHHGRDAVVTAEIVVEPEFVDEAVAVLLQELDTFAAAARDPRGPGQRPEVVYAEDDACWGG